MRARAEFKVVSMALLVSACQSPALELSEADAAAIRTASATYVQTAIARDWAGWGATIADDAVFMPPNQPRLDTRQAVLDWNAASPPVPSLTVTPTEIVGIGDLAYARGTYTLTSAPDGEPPTTDSGSYIEIWRKGNDGQWRVSRDIWNSERPLAP